LLRLLQEREYYPLGADAPKPSSARIVVATNCDLLALQEAGKFRQDLYYRLVLHRIHVPPLRERREDIPLLVEHFLEEAAKELFKTTPTAPPELFTLLSVYPFPGNIRELRALIFDAMSRHGQGKLSLQSFKEVMKQTTKMAEEDLLPKSQSLKNLFASLERLPSFEEAENHLIEEALKRTDGNQSLTAALLGITRQTLHRRLRLQAEKKSKE
jgi:DNA-binding NtrC family response regulator